MNKININLVQIKNQHSIREALNFKIYQVGYQKIRSTYRKKEASIPGYDATGHNTWVQDASDCRISYMKHQVRRPGYCYNRVTVKRIQKLAFALYAYILYIPLCLREYIRTNRHETQNRRLPEKKKEQLTLIGHKTC
jgi:hypothetical protein